MHRLWLFVGVLGASVYQAAAQTPKITTPQTSTTRYIQDLYQYVSDKVKRNQYYTNEQQVNQTNLMWVGADKFAWLRRFHYSMLGEQSPVLRLASQFVQQDTKTSYTEFLYDNDGQLVYVFEKQTKDSALPYYELRAYFERDLCINLVLDKEIINVKATHPHVDKLKMLQMYGKRLAQVFVEEVKQMHTDDAP